MRMLISQVVVRCDTGIRKRSLRTSLYLPISLNGVGMGTGMGEVGGDSGTGQDKEGEEATAGVGMIDRHKGVGRVWTRIDGRKGWMRGRILTLSEGLSERVGKETRG